MKELIKTFLEAFCTIVRDDEDASYVELMMDDHKCIEYEDQQYYVPENNMMYTEDDTLLVEFLVYTYQL